LYYAYGSTKLLQLTLGSAGNALEDDSDVEVVAPEKKSIFSALPLELLGEIVLLLPCSLYKSARTVSRTWLETLNPECQWERVCRMQWPGVTQIMSHSWRKFALQGGGDLLGACVLHHLQNLQSKALACSATTVAQCCLVEAQGMSCDICHATNPRGMTVHRCRTCNYSRCDKCYEALQPPAAMTNGAVNHSSKDGWSSLHYACRLGFKDVVSKLLDARANVEWRDDQHGYTPLMVAATHGHKEICSLLLKRGASKDSINNYSKTAAHCALSWGHSELSRILWRVE